jgi:hypothetical protein
MPRSKYHVQRAQAVRRGIDFFLTFDEWWSLWEPHWSKRGKKSNDLCMARTGDTGPYAVGNVKIITVRDNLKERWKKQ